MAVVKQLVKAGAEQVLKRLPFDQADTIVKHFNFPSGSPHEIFVKDGGIHPMDGPGLINAIKKGEAQDLGQYIDYAVQGEQGALNEIARIADNSSNDLIQDTGKAQQIEQVNNNPLEIPKQPNVVEVGGKAYNYDKIPRREGFDMMEAEEMMQTPEMQKAFAGKQANIQSSFEAIQKQVERNKLEYGTEGAFKKKSRFEGAHSTAVRTSRDAQSGAPKGAVDDILGVQAEPGYGVAKGKTEKTAYREGKLGFKPDNKGRLMNLEQHHAAFPNAEGSALMDQEAIKLNPTFELAIHRYVARKYDAALGSAAKNQANLPYDVHQEMLHRWLEQFNLEEYWRTKPKDMSPAEIIESLDEYFTEIVYPTMAMLDGWMAKSDPTKFNTADVRIPKKLTSQARSFIKKQLKAKAYDPTAGGTRSADVADVMLDKYRRQTEDGRSMFKLRVPTKGMNL